MSHNNRRPVYCDVPIQNVQYLICEDHDRGSGLQHVFSLRQIFQMNLSNNLIGVDWDKAVIKVQLVISANVLMNQVQSALFPRIPSLHHVFLSGP